jgi:archaellum component FlaC
VWAAWVIGIVCIVVLALCGAAMAQSAGKASNADLSALDNRLREMEQQFGRMDERLKQIVTDTRWTREKLEKEKP